MSPLLTSFYFVPDLVLHFGDLRIEGVLCIVEELCLAYAAPWSEDLVKAQNDFFAAVIDNSGSDAYTGRTDE